MKGSKQALYLGIWNGVALPISAAAVWLSPWMVVLVALNAGFVGWWANRYAMCKRFEALDAALDQQLADMGIAGATVGEFDPEHYNWGQP